MALPKPFKWMLVLIGVAASGGILYIGLWMFLPWRIAYAAELRQGQKVIQVVEDFKAKNGRLPNSVDELHLPVTDNGGVRTKPAGQELFYNRGRKELDRYTVWFGTGLGDCISYDSKAKNWDDVCDVIP